MGRRDGEPLRSAAHPWPPRISGTESQRRDQTGGVTTVGRAKGPDVTAREAEVLALIGRHLTNAQIAEALFISVRTVESHVSALLRKLELPDRRSLARYHDAEAGARVRTGRSMLPTPVTPFIGRAAERAALAAALAEHRMVTATGPGGVGKTRLALSVAAEIAPVRRDGVWFVDLVHVTDPAMVIATVAETVGVPEQRAASIDVALVASLAERDALLVIDNCEHLLDGVRECIERILDGCPHVTVLATSRSRLLVPYEWVYVVPGLSVTDDGGDAVELFASRVAAATGGRDRLDPRRVAALCRALDGMALAIELAAARYPTLGLDGLEAGLDERLRFLTAGTRVADRHRSLREAIGWSYDLLGPDDQALLRGVAVFASWFDVDAAHAVAGLGSERAAVADGLARLADHSLLVVERGEPTRYRALETIRQYGVEQLDAAGELDCRPRTPRAVVPRRDRRPRRRPSPTTAWCDRFDRVVDDIRAALVWSAGDERRRVQARPAGRRPGRAAVRPGSTDGGPATVRAGRDARTCDPQRELATCGWPPAPPPAAMSATTPCGCSAPPPTSRSRSATAAVAAVDLAWMSIYIDRCPGIMADKPHTRRGGRTPGGGPGDLRRLGPGRGGDRRVVRRC